MTIGVKRQVTDGQLSTGAQSDAARAVNYLIVLFDCVLITRISSPDEHDGFCVLHDLAGTLPLSLTNVSRWENVFTCNCNCKALPCHVVSSH